VTATTARPAPQSVRRLPVPACEPPYDDELLGRDGGSSRPTRDGSAADAVQGTLALAFVLPSGVPTSPQAPPELHLVPALRPDAERDLDDAEFGPQPTSRCHLPEPRGWSGRFAQAVVEVLAGDRPVTQLVRWTTTDVYDQIACRVLDAASGGAHSARALVRSVHVSEPADGVAEVAAMVRRGLRTTAVAMRLEGLDGRWQCTAVELG
jgi:hypothetical protein